MTITQLDDESASSMPRRSVGEWNLRSATSYQRPFLDVEVDVIFTNPAGKVFTQPAFYDGDNTWRVRFNPGEAGEWTARSHTVPADSSLEREWRFIVEDREARGFLVADRDHQWGYRFEDGSPYFPFGDTAYNLFGMHHCGYDVDLFILRRSEQGFNLLRVRVPVSRFHPPDAISDWQTKSTWPWGGSEQSPLFDRFNLEYFRSVDQVVLWAERHGIGLEMIMEGWGFEFPFNTRTVFTPEWELLWMRYLIARYDAFTSTYFWTPLNEYEYYPNGDWNYKETSDLWQMRMARYIRSVASHGHCVAVHNGPTLPPFSQRFARDPDVMATVMFQSWGTTGEHDGWLAAGLDSSIAESLDGWNNSAIMAEWGYERNPDLPLRVPGHQYCDVHHTRRGAWRSVFMGLGIIHGFENSWGPWCELEEDQPGVAQLIVLNDFVRNTIRETTVSRRYITNSPLDVEGQQPLLVASENHELVLAYLPVGGEITIPTNATRRRSFWLNPETGNTVPVINASEDNSGRFIAPEPRGNHQSSDWILVLDDRD